MEYRIIGWTHFDDGGYPPLDDEGLDSLRTLVVEEIRRCTYRFGGDAHNYLDGCTPVFNSGEKYCVSSYRQWGGIMAEAWNTTGMDGYEYMAFYLDSMVEDRLYPKSCVDNSAIVDKALLTLPQKTKQREEAPELPSALDFDAYVSFAASHSTVLSLGETLKAETPATHEMRLDGVYHSMIAEGVKTVELRLLDEKRRLIRPCDMLTFISRDDESQRLHTRVVKIHVAGGFDELLFDPDILRKSGLSHLGAVGAEELMCRFYPECETEKWGAVGIEIEVIRN